jgi:chemotaxis protein histidine kinase CheA
MSTEASTTGGGTSSGTPQGGDASSAAERLGGPVEDEKTPDTATSTETSADRQADRVVEEDAQRPATASRADTGDDREVDRVAEEDEQRPETASRAEASDGRDADNGATQPSTLIPAERAESYQSRWNELKSEFVDEPRDAVRGANELVGEVLDELEELFRNQRADLEHGLDSEQTTTEDLRQALGRYRSFFDRLLSI